MGPPTLPCKLLLAACVLTLPLAASAQWKWRDGRGQIQYSDLPPPKGTAPNDILQVPRASPVAKLTQPPSAASGPVPSPAGAPGADPALDAKRRQSEEAEAARRKAEELRIAQTRAQSCERARGYMRTLESGQRLARVNERGEREIIDDGIRQAELAQTREVIASECR